MRGLARACATGVLALALVACGSVGASGGTLYDTINDETGAYEIVAENADKGASIGSLGGGITVGEGQSVCVKADLTAGAVKVTFMDEAGKTVLEETLTGSTQNLYGLGYGEFSFSASAEENGTAGTVTIVVVDDDLYEEEDGDLEATLQQMAIWTSADTVQEAAAGAGFEELVLPDNLLLEVGPVNFRKLRYERAHVIAEGSAGAAELIVHKAIYVGDGDIIGDDVTYAQRWTQDVDGIEVISEGNARGQATKTVWVDGNYMYGILALGQGAERETFGLGDADVATLVHTIH